MSIKIIFCIFHFSLKLYIKHMNSSLNVFPYSYSSSVLRPQWAQQTTHWTATNSLSEPSEKKSGELWIKRKLGEWNKKNWSLLRRMEGLSSMHKLPLVILHLPVLSVTSVSLPHTEHTPQKIYLHLLTVRKTFKTCWESTSFFYTIIHFYT